MIVSAKDIEQYLDEVKEFVSSGRYRIDTNKSRQKNRELYADYVIDEERSRAILLSLTVSDFSEIRKNEHKGFEYENLYVFGKEVELIKRFGRGTKRVALYIKLNKLECQYVVVISFHVQKYPMEYAFL